MKAIEALVAGGLVMAAMTVVVVIVMFCISKVFAALLG